MSHASADAELVDAFVDRLLRNGCNLSSDDIFYTSGEDTGIASGEDLIATVRSQVDDATLVVAIITPTYQTRPICIAELGAAWSRAGRLMPLLLPGLERENLEGVLAGMTMRALDDSATLDELHDRVSEAAGVEARAATWNRHKQRWLTIIPELVETVPTPETASDAEVEQLRRDLAGVQAALEEVDAESAKLKRDLKAVSALKNAGETAVALLPEDELERFRVLADRVSAALKPLDGVVVDAIWSSRFGSGLQRPSWFDEHRRAEEADANLDAGFLQEGDDGELHPNLEAGSIERAEEEVKRLQRFLTEERGAAFAEWFKQEHDFEPDLAKKHVWDQLF